MDDVFDLAGAEAQDEATLAIRHPTTDKPTTWLWTFYGPGHPKTVELADRVTRDALRELQAQKQARINGKKYKADDRSVDELRDENVGNIIARLKTFTPVKLGAETISFTPEAARALLLDRKKSWLYVQVVEFLKEDENFIQPSATS